MPSKHRGFLRLDDQGRLILPDDLASAWGLQPSDSLPFHVEDGAIRLQPSIHAVQRVYIEPTNQCNLDCRTCMRNAWDERPGCMSAEIFQRILADLAAFSPLPMVFFGGYGEPLAHPQILPMIRAVKALGVRVEMITNGTLLDAATASGLVQEGLDRLWVSLDGATPEGYLDVRLGDLLPRVTGNLERLKEIRRRANSDTPSLGIAFVAMKRNIHELPEVIRLGRRLGADMFSISNVLAHTPELREESLYARSYYEADMPASEWSPLVELPRMEVNEWTAPALAEALKGRVSMQIAGQTIRQGASTCPFLEKRSLSVRWDGSVAACLPLLHTHTAFLQNKDRTVTTHTFGNVLEQPLEAIWRSEAFQAFRERLWAFDFSPCVTCNSCELSENNQEDCFGNMTPTCGGCLWAQGFIRCP